MPPFVKICDISFDPISHVFYRVIKGGCEIIAQTIATADKGVIHARATKDKISSWHITLCFDFCISFIVSFLCTLARQSAQEASV